MDSFNLGKFAEFGLAGLVIAALFVTLWHQNRQHREERRHRSDPMNRFGEKIDRLSHAIRGSIR